jgi:hypothetical protein
MKEVIFLALFLVLCIIQPSFGIAKTLGSNYVSEITESPQAWPWVVAGVVYVIVRLGEGQAHIIYENGQIKEKHCRGIGSCAAGLIGGNGANTWIDSPYEAFGYDFEVNGMAVIRTTDGKLILTHREGQVDPNLNRFFYSNEIVITPQLTFNNPEHLQALGLSQPFTIGGTYQVQERQGFRYIILNQESKKYWEEIFSVSSKLYPFLRIYMVFCHN